VYVCKRERESVCMRVRDRESVCVYIYICKNVTNNKCR